MSSLTRINLSAESGLLVWSETALVSLLLPASCWQCAAPPRHKLCRCRQRHAGKGGGLHLQQLACAGNRFQLKLQPPALTRTASYRSKAAHLSREAALPVANHAAHMLRAMARCYKAKQPGQPCTH